MSNPWLKKNPFLSMWLSAANSATSAARGQAAAAWTKASQDALALWLPPMPAKPKARTRRKSKR